jgi:two-component system sensor histidine kinase TorS
MMSHEIRTPMNGVLGLLRSLDREGLSGRQRAHLRAARASGEGLMAILNDILDYSKIEAGAVTIEAATFAPADLVRDIALLMIPGAREKGLEVRLDVPTDAPAAVVGDVGKLRQILFNLVSNAIKFTERGGVTLALRVGPTDGARVAGEGVVGLEFVVSDTGKGIAEDAQERIFGVFEQEDAQTARQFGGTGLGLAISRRFARAMGAGLTVRSRPGEGARFTLGVTLPLGRPEDLPVPERPEAVLAPVSERLRLLVVEDNETNRMVLRAYLDDMGHEARMVGTGEAALAALAAAEFDAVLMDVNLPGLSGSDTTRAIRAHPDPRRAGVPVIGISAHVQERERAETLAAGMSCLLAKPLTPEALAEALDRMCRSGDPLARLVADLGPDRARDLGLMFLRQLDADLAQIRGDDRGEVREAAHRLRGAAGNFDLDGLPDSLAAVEEAAAEADLSGLEAARAALTGAVEAARRAMARGLARLEPPVTEAAQ